MSPWHFTFLGYQLGFARPALLLSLLGAALLGALGVWVALRGSRAIERLVPGRLIATLAPGARPLLAVARTAASTMALGLFAVALAQPQCGQRSEVVKRRGIDVVVALDASKSMYARDVTPSRLVRAKLELTGLLDELKGDRVAIVAFAGDAFIQCPLTTDYAAAKIFLRAVDPKSMPQGGTDIGAALRLARRVFDAADRGARDKVVVLLSDGEDLGGDVQSGIDQLKEIDARVYAVGIGGETGEPVPLGDADGAVTGYLKDRSGKTVLTRLNATGLAEIATKTGGAFFSQPNGVAVQQVAQAIDALQKEELSSHVSVRYGEGFQYFVGAGLAFLVAAMVIPTSWRRKVSS